MIMENNNSNAVVNNVTENDVVVQEERVAVLSKKLTKTNNKKHKLKRKLKKAKDYSYCYDKKYKKLKKKYRKCQTKARKIKKRYAKALMELNNMIRLLEVELHQSQNQINELIVNNNTLKLNDFGMKLNTKELIYVAASRLPNFNELNDERLEQLYRRTWESDKYLSNMPLLDKPNE